MKSIADKKHVEEILGKIAIRVPELSKKYKPPPSESGKPEYSIAVGRMWWEYKLERKNAGSWQLYAGRYHPHSNPKYREYLVDFMLIEVGYGARIACESEWGNKAGDVEWDFDKLSGVKADIKVLIHECADSTLLEKLKKDYLADNALISSDEAFLFVRFECNKLIDPCWWKPSRKGPFKASEISLDPLSLSRY